ncbi:ABC transporter ATP-binding protein [Slackia exigua]|uniref:ABC transporter ATP-binding protein n=1 Tax=Slackia exigua TaxID=84109 RepID=UPI0020062938|nr:ABC transporter ATP-binding protein [Slackia exigua]MCK6139003.1 ABC transporter ATP-binding protein/permease [Slackia exigua]
MAKDEEKPQVKDKPTDKGPNPVALLLEWSEENRIRYALSVVLAIIGVAGSVVPYFAAGSMINGVLSGMRDFGFYVQWALVAAAGHAVYLVFHNLSTVISHRATFSTISKIRRRLTEKLARVEMGHVLDTPSGTLKNVIVEKADAIETTLAHAVPELTSGLIVPLAVVGYIFALDWRMGLVALVTLPVGALCYMGMMRDYETMYGAYVSANAHMNATAVEYVNGIEVIKAFGQEASSYEKFAKAVHDAAHSAIDWMAKVQIFQDGAISIWPATLVTVLPVGCFFVLDGSLSSSDLVLIAVLALGIFPPLMASMSLADNLAQIGTIVGDISKVLDLPDQRRSTTKADLSGSRIELAGVRFSYGDEEVIHGIDLSIEPGNMVALVGPSGSGKSTLGRLLAGFWDADAGTVSIGGVPLEDMTPEQQAGLIAYVSQDNYLFDETIMDNIRMGRPGASDEEVVAIAEASGCDEFIRGLDEGYRTRVGGAGGHLSGGERQRIAIARAMLKDAPIVILDEATAYTDPENEAVIEEAVGRLVAGRTLIVIAHRLSTIVGADEIVVVDDGAVRARGTHAELMENCPLYADMYRAHISAKDAA